MNMQWTLALRYLNGRKLRSLLTTLAVVFGVMVIFGVNFLIPTMMQAFQSTMLAASSTVDLTITNRTGEAFPLSVLDTVRGIQGVQVAQGLLSRPINLPTDFYDHNPRTPDQVSIVSLVGLDVQSAEQIRHYSLQQGRFLEPSDTAASVIAQSLADALNLKVGDQLALPTVQGVVNLSVVGILPPRTTPGNEEILLNLPEAQQLLDATGKINVIEANFTPGDAAHRAQVENTLEQRLGEAYQFGALPSGSDLYASLNLAQAMFNVFGVLALFMGAFIIFNTFRTLVAERRRDIGMLRAVGANRRTIIGMILMEGLLQGGAGTIVGILLGYGFGYLAMWALTPIIQRYIHMSMGAPVVSPGLLIGTVLLGVGITLLAGLFPAVSAGRVTPLEALRPSLGKVDYRKVIGAGAVAGLILIGLSVGALLSGNVSLVGLGSMLFMAGLVLLAPALVRPIALGFGALLARTMAREGTGQLAQGNLVRQPGRAAITASTTMIALAILVVVGGLTTTLKTTFLEVLKKTLGSDYLFIPPSVAVWGNNIGADPSFAQKLRDVNGVGPVSTFRFAVANADLQPVMPSKGTAQTTTGSGIAVSMLGLDPVAYPQVASLRFEKGNAAKAFPALASGRTLIANGVFASTTGLKVGDEVPLITPTGRHNYQVIAIANDFLDVKVTTAYISQANLAADFGKTEDVFIQLDLKPGADRAQVETQLKAIKQNYPQFTMISGQTYYQQTVDLFNTAFAGMFVLFIFLTIPSLIAMINTLAISVIERTREIGMLRAVGSTQKQIRRIILAEALLLALAGTVFGLLAGLYLNYTLVSAFRMAGFPVDFFFPWVGLIYATLVGVLFGALAAIIPARQASRLEIVSALQYE